ncbi:T9SS type A sorting domain-containing protein [Brumimicrobium mesophilum]|uniref:T9SS type A sorting domain-containing protein n=1 Tax=Brumimicrobium mesophilum TaxID=392717 RepID=UPI000D144A14|nr:T9SS type A sorting domain-containing protein [Brumimicrobium mesophilum]
MKHFKTILIFLATFLASESFSQFAPRNIVDANIGGVSEIITPDLNNDNLPDIVVSQKYNPYNKVSYYINQGAGIFGNQQVIDSNIYYPTDLASADFDGNGWKDIVSFTTEASGDLFIYLNNTATISSRIIIDSNLNYNAKVKTDDIDIDGNQDIILITDLELIVYYNDGTGSFTKNIIPSGILTEYYELSIADIDNDGFKDIVIGGIKTIIYKNTNGVISYDSLRTANIPENNTLVFLTHLNDFDGDGDLDLLTDKSAANNIRWYSNDGNGNFLSPLTIDSNAMQCKSITSADFDNDGDFDLYTTMPQLGTVVWYENDGAGNFGSPILIHQGVIVSTVEVATDDLNNDGLPDIIWSNELSIHLNNSSNLSTEDFTFKKKVKVYPNPTSKTLNIISSEDDSSLTLMNNIGQVVMSEYSLSTGHNVLSLDLKPGIYFLIIEKDGLLERQKILIE